MSEYEDRRNRLIADRLCTAELVASGGPCAQPAPNHQLAVGGSEVKPLVLPVCDEHFAALVAGGMLPGERMEAR